MSRIYYITRNLGRESGSKIDFVESAHSFPDFFIIQDEKKESSKWKKQSKFPIWEEKKNSKWKKQSKFPIWKEK